MACGMICCHGVAKRFGAVRAVDRAALRRAGEFVALLGPSGCGKTTLLRLIAGFETPDAGTVELAGDPVAGAARWVPPERRRVGMVFQDYALFPHLTVAENIGFGLPRRERKRARAELLALVDLCGLGEPLPARALRRPAAAGRARPSARARPGARAARRAVVEHRPAPARLDARRARRDPARDRRTVLLVTHDQEEAFALADRVALMRDGRIVQEGTPEELYFAPATRWAAEFVGAANFVPGTLANGIVETPVGASPR